MIFCFKERNRIKAIFVAIFAFCAWAEYMNAVFESQVSVIRVIIIIAKIDNAKCLVSSRKH